MEKHPQGRVLLTDRERDILRWLTNGLTDQEIAEAVILTVGTVKWYNHQIYNKLGVRNRTEAIMRAQQLGLLGGDAKSTSLGLSQTPPNNLPAQITSFVGRSREISELKAMLLASRLVTLTGPPGTGKTRLALEVASSLIEHYPHGLYFVSLASLRDPGHVAHAIAQVLAVKESGNLSILAALKAALSHKQILLVLDNFEHLLPAAPIVSELLAAAPHLTVLVTSREILHLYGEQEFAVPPLQLPDLKKKATVAVLLSFEAVELFIQRARSAQPSLILSDDNADSVSAICVHLDGLPLAIELAAARSKFYAPQMLLVRLSQRLEALGEGARDLPARQRTLRATLAWSYDLLTAQEQRLFARLSVFAGEFSATDAYVICGEGLSSDVATDIESLLNKSLLRQTSSVMNVLRFSMLETMREYAVEKLVERGEFDQIRERHAHYFLALAEQVQQELTGPNEAEWHARLESQHDNFREALQWGLNSDDTEQTSLRLAARLDYFWWTRGYVSEGRTWLEAALRHKGANAPTQMRADALRGAGFLAYQQCDYQAARDCYREALAIYRRLSNQHSIAEVLLNLGDVEMSVGDYQTSESLIQQGTEIMQTLGDSNGYAHALDYLAWCVLRGDSVQATAWFEQALALFKQVNNLNGMGLVLSGLGEIALRRGDLEQAARLLEQSLGLRQQLGQKWGIAATLGSLAWLAQIQDDLERARLLLKESFIIRRDLGDLGGMAWCLEKLAEIAHLQRSDGMAARLLGAATALRANVNSIIDPNDQSEYDRLIARVLRRLGDDVFNAVWAEGEAMPLNRLIEFVALSKHSFTEV